MAKGADVGLGQRIFFTEPWEPLVVRRGDALGLRALADQFADALAPDLNNRINDGRWVTILAWCLVRSQEVFHASGRSSVGTRDLQRERYAWLRPLELMWVARTIALLAEDRGWKNRPIAGRQRVQPWYEVDNQTTERFGMSVDQFRAYRQTGMYGGYRLAFRKWPGMTISGDGWTPGKATNDLAKWLDDKLGKAARPPFHADGENGFSTTSAKRGRNKEDRWWCKKWPNFNKRGREADQNTLPRPKKDFLKLPEGDLLKPLVFGKDQNGRKRLEIACEVAHSKAKEHTDVCEYLARKFASDPTLKLLPMFSRLADAGMEVMDLVAESLKNENGSCVKLADIAVLPEAEHRCKELMVAAQKWRKNADGKLRHIETAHHFVKAITSVQPTECLRKLLKYHEDYGGGLRWFVLRNGTVEPRTPPGTGSSRYRFRLYSLCRLATQCGVLGKMPPALRGNEEAENDEISESTYE